MHVEVLCDLDVWFPAKIIGYNRDHNQRKTDIHVEFKHGTVYFVPNNARIRRPEPKS